MTSRRKENARFGREIALEAMLGEESINLLSRACRREILRSDRLSRFKV